MYRNDSLFVSSFTSIYEYTINGKLLNVIYEDLEDNDTVTGFELSNNGSQIYKIKHSKDALIKADRKGIVIS